ncbi:MAG: bifunctional adenosylcobinamide kinase/adenosylcobinamide-phosphate guanylyltransferase [Oscillospiraceae bacterium]|nr:bifunctional adenosylcobinamide kinase/adenosylcobinamide-phosphate guanylyltransferase [Oscillospiraceae bacterium]
MLALIIGGSASGKSEFAECLAVELGGELTYVAAMKPYDEECVRRIERHRAMRAGKGFKTEERYTNIKDLQISGTAVLECMSNLTANEMYCEGGSGEGAVEEILLGVECLAGSCDNLIIVTNEVFSDGIEYDGDTKKYMRNLGEINCRIAERADAVYEVVCGTANKLK